MTPEKDTYKTIIKPSDSVLFKDRNSKFYGFAFPVINQDDVKKYIEQLKKEHHSARHWCYAYQLGTNKIVYRVNDDGEPNNSAGQPIYGQIQSFEVTNVLIVVVRYFGGTKLGVSGLINAYKTAAKLALENTNIIEKTIDIHYKISFEYKNMNTVMRIVKEKKLTITKQKLELSCELFISTRKSNAEDVFNAFNKIHEIQIEELT